MYSGGTATERSTDLQQQNKVCHMHVDTAIIIGGSHYLLNDSTYVHPAKNDFLLW